MTTLAPGTQVEGDPVDEFDVVPKGYVDAATVGHTDDVTDGGAGPAITVRTGVRAAVAFWSGFETVVSGHGYYQIQMATDSGFASIVDDLQTKANWTTFEGLTSGTTYYWRVRAVDAAGNTSAWTTTVPSDTPDQVDTPDVADDAITTVKIRDANITNAKIASLSASKITAGTIDSEAIILAGVFGIIKSDFFITGVSGWQITGDGNAEFNNVTVRGTVDSSTIIGSTFQTAADGNDRIELNSSGLQFFDSADSLIGEMFVDAAEGYTRLDGSFAADDLLLRNMGNVGSWIEPITVALLEQAYAPSANPRPGMSWSWLYDSSQAGSGPFLTEDAAIYLGTDRRIHFYNSGNGWLFDSGLVRFDTDVEVNGTLDIIGGNNLVMDVNQRIETPNHAIIFERVGTLDNLHLGGNDQVSFGSNAGTGTWWGRISTSVLTIGGQLGNPASSQFRWRDSTDERIIHDDANNRYDFYEDGAISSSTLRSGAFTVVSDPRDKRNLRAAARLRQGKSVLAAIKEVEVEDWDVLFKPPDDSADLKEPLRTRRGVNTRAFAAAFGEDHPALVKTQVPTSTDVEESGPDADHEAIDLYGMVSELWRGLQEVSDRLAAAGI